MDEKENAPEKERAEYLNNVIVKQISILEKWNDGNFANIEDVRANADVISRLIPLSLALIQVLNC